MSDQHCEFTTFYHNINMTAFQTKMMRDLRQSLRNRIRRYFHEKLRLRQPNFCPRGRQATATTIAPNYGEFLIDEAVVLQHLDKKMIDKWPSPEILHMMMLSSIRDHTPDPPAKRKYSVCVRYSGFYKAEISILAPGSNGNLIGINDIEGWRPDTQKNLVDFFKAQIMHHGLQLQRIACYLNAWADFHPNQLHSFAWLLPLDVLTARYFQAYIGRDDYSLAKTAEAIAEAMHSDFQWVENTLSWPLSEQESWSFSKSLEMLVKRSHLAVITKDKTHACAIWRSLLGDRFPMAGANSRKLKSRIISQQFERERLVSNSMD